MIIKKIVSYLCIWVNVFSIILYIKERNLLKQDVERLLHTTPFSESDVLSFNYLMLFNKPFRSVFRYRISSKNAILTPLTWFTPRSLKSIEIGGEINGGLAVFHNLGAVIALQKAGKNLSVGHGVTIGRSDRPDVEGRDCPIIGDNVRICTNSVVFGPITIGDNVVVGAGTVLCKSVPANCSVVGNPARIISKDGQKCNIEL